MRITLFIDHLGCGGAQRQMVMLAILFKRHGFDPQLLTYNTSSFFLPSLEREGIPVRTIASQSKLQRILNVRRELRVNRPDAVIAYLNTPNILAEVAGWPRRDFRLIVSERSYNGGERMTRQRWFNYFRYRMHLLADAVVTNCQSERDFMVKAVPQLAARSHVISNCVDLEQFHARRERTAGFQSGRSARILVAANFGPLKNSLGLAQGLKIARDRRPNLNLTVDWYGNNFYRDGQPTASSRAYSETCAFISRHGLHDHFRTHTQVDDIRTLYHNHSALCLPSFTEGFPNAVGEAMACAMPILVSRVSDNTTLVRDGENGFLFDPYDPSSIAEALIKFSHQPQEDVARMGSASRSLAEQLLAPMRLLEQYTRLLKTLCGDSRGKLQLLETTSPTVGFRTRKTA